MAKRKVYVKVLMMQDENGEILPLQIVWDNGKSYEVDVEEITGGAAPVMAAAPVAAAAPVPAAAPAPAGAAPIAGGCFQRAGRFRGW